MAFERLIGVYHADGGLMGELSYLVGKVRGVAHCALCDITHQTLWTKPEWRGLVSRLGKPFDLVHLNEQSEALEAFTTGGTPCVVGESGGTLHLLLGPDALETCEGQVSAFEEALVAAIESSALR